MVRTAIHDTILPTGGGPSGTSPIFVFAGSDVVTSFYTLHRNPAVFGAHCDVFDPDRWTRVSPEHWEFMGFSGGPRSCEGQQKALAEAAWLLARLVARFKRCEGRDERPWEGVTRLIVRNNNGCKVALFRE